MDVIWRATQKILKGKVLDLIGSVIGIGLSLSAIYYLKGPAAMSEELIYILGTLGGASGGLFFLFCFHLIRAPLEIKYEKLEAAYGRLEVSNVEVTALADTLQAQLGVVQSDLRTALEQNTTLKTKPACVTIDLKVAADGQTTFTLPEAPTQPQYTELVVNGISYRGAKHLVVSGATLTWCSTDFILETTDHIFASWW